MQEQHLFEYAIIRVVPRVEREEFINVGVILYCKPLRFLKGMFFIDRNKIMALNPNLDIEELEKNLDAFIAICDGRNTGSTISDLDLPSRFRWLTATRSTVVQCSKVHPGFCTNAQEELLKIFEQMVL